LFELGPGRTASTVLKAAVVMWRGVDKSQPGDVSPPCHPDRHFFVVKVVPPPAGLFVFFRRWNGTYVRAPWSFPPSGRTSSADLAVIVLNKKNLVVYIVRFAHQVWFGAIGNCPKADWHCHQPVQNFTTSTGPLLPIYGQHVVHRRHHPFYNFAKSRVRQIVVILLRRGFVRHRSFGEVHRQTSWIQVDIIITPFVLSRSVGQPRCY